MTEQASLTEQIIRPSVEEIHASIPHKGVRDLLNDANNIQRHMNRELEDIETDEDLNPEAKQRRAQEVIACWDKSLGQNVLRLHLNNGRYIKVFEADTADTLTSLGLDEFVEDWTFNLEKDVG
jgi:hypothetical protein